MEYIYAALLLDAVGKEVTEDSIKSVVKAAGKEPDEAMAKSVVSALKGVNIKDVIKNAQAVQATAQAAAPQAAKQEEKKSEAEEKKSEEAAASGLASLFG